jgi:hypothetical protein
MIAELEAAVETEMFTTLVDVSLTDQDSSSSGGWRSETRLHVLAFEITRYMPELANSTIARWNRKVTVCCLEIGVGGI